jgi:tol-pal system protein YbgF
MTRAVSRGSSVPCGAARFRRPRAAHSLVLGLALGSLAPVPGCVPPQLLTLRAGLDSLRTVVDTLVVRDAIAYRVIAETRQELAEQRELLLSSRATTGTTARDLTEQMSRLEARLEEAMGRVQQISQRVPSAPPAAPGGGDPAQIYDQAAKDLTQGRYAMALIGYRDFLKRFPGSELADDAQYGVGECLFAQSQFDSARVEYGRVETLDPKGERVAPSLYKRALCEERLGRAAESRKLLEDLVRRYPLSGEAQLARERLSRPNR